MNGDDEMKKIWRKTASVIGNIILISGFLIAAALGVLFIAFSIEDRKDKRYSSL
jgi:hypothetical protein